MKINKILNNNTVLVIDDQGQEKIAMGKGIAFGRKVGELCEKSQIERLYTLENKGSDQLLESIPQDILYAADYIVRMVKEKLETEISDALFVAIADHLNGAVIRSKEGVSMKNFLLWDVKNIFREEFEICREAMTKVSEEMHIDFTEDEVGFIVLHIVSASLSNENSAAEVLLKLMEEILTVIKYSLKTSFDDDDIYFQRFKTHLKFFTERILTHKKLEGDLHNGHDSEMFEMMKNKYPESFETVEKVKDFIKKQYNYEISPDEQFYLMVHLSRIMKKSEVNKREKGVL